MARKSPVSKPGKAKRTGRKAPAKKRNTTAAAAAKRTARRKRAVAGAVAGRSTSEIARDQDCSRTTIAADLKSAEARMEGERLIARYSPYIDQLLEKALLRIGDALDAKRVVVLAVGLGITEASELEYADYNVRLAAVKRLAEIIRLARPAGVKTPEEEDAGRSWSHADFRSLIEKHAERLQ
jgi:hypothetical protein